MIDGKDAVDLLSCVKHDDRLHIIMLEVLANQSVCEEVREAYLKLLQEIEDAKCTK